MAMLGRGDEALRVAAQGNVRNDACGLDATATDCKKQGSGRQPAHPSRTTWRYETPTARRMSDPRRSTQPTPPARSDQGCTRRSRSASRIN